MDYRPTSAPLAVRPGEAARLIGLSRAEVFRRLQRGEIPSVKVGHARLIPFDELRAWLARQVS